MVLNTTPVVSTFLLAFNTFDIICYK
jgi:hypothetical protein